MGGITCKNPKYDKLEINEHEDFAEILPNFQPSDLLQAFPSRPEESKNSSHSNIQQKKPFVLYLPRTKPDNFPKLNNFEFETFCKKRIKYLNYYAISAYFFNNTPKKNKDRTQKKLYYSLRNLKACKDVYFFNNYKPFTANNILKIRKAFQGFIKTIRLAECEGPSTDLFKDSRIKSLNVDFQRTTYLGTTVRSLKLKRIFQPGEDTSKILNRIRKYIKLQKLTIMIEDYRKILKNQESLSEALGKLKSLRELDLGLTFMVEKEDLFDRGEEADQEIDLNLLLWKKITGLHISDDDIPLDQIMYKVEYLKSLLDFSYYGEPKFREDFDYFQNLSQLYCLKKIYISISMLGIPGHTGASFFEKDFLPGTIEEFTLRVELQRLSTVFEKAIESGNFFHSLEKMKSLKYILLNISIEGEEFGKKDHKLLSLFFSKAVKSLPTGLEDLFLMISGFQRFLITEEMINVSEDQLCYLISQQVPNLRNLLIKFPSINTSMEQVKGSMLKKLQCLNIEGAFPLLLVEMIGSENLEEIYCQVSKKLDIREFISFLKEITKFQKIRVLNINIKALYIKRNEDEKELSCLNKELFLGIVNLFKQLKLMNDFSLIIQSVNIEKRIGEYLVQLCKYKKGLRFCNLEFENCEIFKEYFTSIISEGIFSSDEQAHSETSEEQ